MGVAAFWIRVTFCLTIRLTVRMREIPTEVQRTEIVPAEKDPARRIRPGMPRDLAPRRKKRVLPYAIAVLVIGLGAVWWVNHSHNSQEAAPNRGGGRRGFGMGMSGPLPVVVRPAVKADLNLYLDGLGTVTALANVTIRTQISGQLMEVDFKEGQSVNKGDLLAVIDPRPYQVALEQAQGQLTQAQAQLTAAQADLSRYQTLASQDSISTQQVDAQRATVGQYTGQVQTDQAAIDSAKLNLAYCHITAPVAGRVGLRQIDPGNYVTPGDASGLVVLTQVSPISVIFTLPEDQMSRVAGRLHSGAQMPVDAYDRTATTKLASGQLATIDNQADTSTGTIKLRATFDNSGDKLFPNQFVNVRMLLDVDRGVTVVPTSAIERGQQGTFVYLVKPDNTVAAQTVALGPTEGERVEVAKGLNPGDRVVVDGADRLKDGMKVIPQSGASQGGNGPAGGDRPHRRRSSGGDGSQS